MYDDLFISPSEHRMGAKVYAQLNYIRTAYNFNLKQLYNFYRNTLHYVNNRNILVRLIRTLSPSMDISDSVYLNIIKSKGLYVAKRLDIISDINYGDIQSNIFYDNDSYEMVLGYSPIMELEDLNGDWKEWTPITVLTHPWIDINLFPPNGNKRDTGNGLSSIMINIPLLMMQYRAFIKDQLKEDSGNDILLSENYYVDMFALPNMVKQQIDLGLWNMLKAKFYGTEYTTSVGTLAPWMHNYTSHIDKLCSEIIKDHIDRPQEYVTTLGNIPAICSKSMLDVLKMPDISQTRQVWWALLLTRIDDIIFLIDLQGYKGISFNRKSITNFQTTVQYILKFNVYHERLSRYPVLLLDTISKLENILLVLE